MVRPATFTLRITDSAGKPVENAQVTGSLNMTLMDMGKTAVKFQSEGNGVYEVTVSSFDMSGPWEIAIDAVQNRMHAHKVFPVTVFD
jgi:nitrogen fixation protein FixH